MRDIARAVCRHGALPARSSTEPHETLRSTIFAMRAYAIQVCAGHAERRLRSRTGSVLKTNTSPARMLSSAAKLLERLPPRCREALLLRVIDELSARRNGEAECICRSARSRSVMARGKQIFRRHLTASEKKRPRRALSRPRRLACAIAITTRRTCSECAVHSAFQTMSRAKLVVAARQFQACHC